MVTDGFTGNVVVKLGVGLGRLFVTMIKDAANRGGITAKLGALLLKPALKKYMMKKLNYEEEGGAPLLGINGTLIISHGASRRRAIRNAVRLASQVAEERIPDIVRETLQEELKD